MGYMNRRKGDIFVVLMDDSVGRNGIGEWPFSGPDRRKRALEVELSDGKVLDMVRKEGPVAGLAGVEVVRWLTWGKMGEVGHFLTCNCLHGVLNC
jgi:hypothetical protein